MVGKFTVDGRRRPYPPLKVIKRLADKIYSNLLLFADKPIQQEEIVKIGQRLIEIFKPPEEKTIFDCLIPIYNQTLNKYEIELFAWRLAANARRIRNSIPVSFWFGQTKEEPAICQFIAPEEEGDIRQGFMRYCILTGPAATLTGRIFINGSRRYRIYRASSVNDHLHLLDLSAATFTCLLIPSRASYPMIDPWTIGCTKKLTERNKKLFDLWLQARRERVEIKARNAYYVPVILKDGYTKDLVISF
jgi:hypothetical protein